VDIATCLPGRDGEPDWLLEQLAMNHLHRLLALGLPLAAAVGNLALTVAMPAPSTLVARDTLDMRSVAVPQPAHTEPVRAPERNASTTCPAPRPV
jgi:hypothetical protein